LLCLKIVNDEIRPSENEGHMAEMNYLCTVFNLIHKNYMRTKQKLRLLMTLLLCAALGQVWANEIVAYTFTTPKGENDYTKFRRIAHFAG
jgi:hypothetical protein